MTSVFVSDTFDVQNITEPSVLNGQMCFNISYVKGHKNAHCFAKLTCGTLEYTQMITGISGCINNMLPHESCNLTVTDGDDDAVHNINTAAPVTITGISVPSYTVAPSTTSTTPTTTPTGCIGAPVVHQ